MRWTMCKLQQCVKIQSSLGQFKESWEDIETIEVVINNKLYSNVTNDLVYRAYAPSAITKFKEFEKEATYRLLGDTYCYEVTSFNNGGRFTQLLLQEVVANG